MFMGTAFSADAGLAAPTPEKSPRLDEVATNLRPVLAWVNSEGGVAPRYYVVQVDTSPSFKGPNLIEIAGVPEEVYVTTARLPKPLKDNMQWFWRVKAIDATGKESPWSTECGGVTARFFLNTAMETRLDHVRVPTRDLATSYGYGKEYILDYDDDNNTYWEGAANQSSHWVQFDLGDPQPASRIFLVSGTAGWKARLPKGAEWASKSNLDGRLESYIWQYSDDGKTWTDIPETQRKKADAFREIIDINKPVSARYFKLNITGWHGHSPRVYDVILYKTGQPPVPQVPKENYVLVVSNVLGFTPQAGVAKTEFGKMIKGEGGHVAPRWKLDVLELPVHMFSPEVLNQMNPKPIAIFLTGSPNWFAQVPHFEFAGQYELTKTTTLPTWGSCASLQMMAMAYGTTFARHVGRSYTTNEVKDIVEHDIPPIYIQKKDQIFAGLTNPFYGPEFHSWVVQVVPEGYEVLATSRDSKGVIVNEMIRAVDRPVYGSQFHPEIAKPFSASKAVLMNFLTMAVERAKSQGTWISE
jgi:GMP synthase-like glutamine amidotransferase